MPADYSAYWAVFWGGHHFLSVPCECLNLHPDVLGWKDQHKPLLSAVGSDVIDAQSGGFDGNLGKRHGFYRRVCFASIFKCKSCWRLVVTSPHNGNWIYNWEIRTCQKGKIKIIIKKNPKAFLSGVSSLSNTLTAIVHPERSLDNLSVATGCFRRMSWIAGG